MKQTLKQQAINLLKNEWPFGLTHDQIATRLGANTPSIRRVTQQLRCSNNIRWRIYGYAGEIEFVYNKNKADSYREGEVVI